jgi:hypothetical protein
MAKTRTTRNGGTQFEHTGTHAVEFFSKAGSLFTKRKQHYGGETSALALFQQVWRSGNHEVAMKLLFWLRDPRGGAGNRSGFRECASWLAQEAPEWMVANAISIPKYGRYDDLQALYVNDATAHTATAIWANDIATGNVLASKWADITTDKKLLKAIRKTDKAKFKDIGAVRRYIAQIRNTVVEVAMSKKEYSAINYSHTPSVAMARYTKAFLRNDDKRFTDYKAKLVKAIETGDKSVKVNAGAIFPHDIWRTLKSGGDKNIADAQFASLPNFMEGTNARILPIADTSGSMSCRVSGDIQAIDISMSLALYCSDRLDKENPFYRKFLEFSCESRMIDWSKHKGISDVYADKRIVTNAVGSTNIERALDTILSFGTMFNARKDQMPNCILIISDMQFDRGSTSSSQNDTVVNACMKKWEDVGFDRPTIVYWNTAGNSGSPEKAKTPNVALVSGFSPSILKAVFSDVESLTPYGIMMEAIKGYEVIIPQ